MKGCPRCGPVDYLLRLVVEKDGRTKSEKFPGEINCVDLELYYCPVCRILAAKGEDEARLVLGGEPGAEASLEYW